MFRRVAGSCLRRLVKYLPVVMVVVALLIVVGGQAMLANGQVRMARLDQQLKIAQSEHRQQELNVTRLKHRHGS